MSERRHPDQPLRWGPALPDSSGPPESVEDAAISLDQASALMADLGFVVFRTPPDSATPDSCLMAMINESPTTRHFDPELISFWVTGEGRGRIRESCDPPRGCGLVLRR